MSGPPQIFIIFAAQFQSEVFRRLGMTPVAALGDALPAIQQGTINGAVTGIGPVANFHRGGELIRLPPSEQERW